VGAGDWAAMSPYQAQTLYGSYRSFGFGTSSASLRCVLRSGPSLRAPIDFVGAFLAVEADRKIDSSAHRRNGNSGRIRTVSVSSMSQLKTLSTAFCLIILWSAAAVGQSHEPTENGPSWHQLNVKYARAKMLLAEAELRIATDANKQSPGAIARLVMERLKSNVAIAEQQLEEAKLATVGGNDRIRMRHAEEKIRLAKLDWESGKRMNDRGLMTDLELERLKLKLELANLSLVLLKNPQYFTTLLQSLEAKVDRMGDEILSIDQRLSKLEPLRGILPPNQ
jgi:hypothetical protein